MDKGIAILEEMGFDTQWPQPRMEKTGSGLNP
jgi:hypothetical protein